MMVKRAAYDSAKGFDERFQVSNCDVDFCLKVAKEGYLIAITVGWKRIARGAIPVVAQRLPKSSSCVPSGKRLFCIIVGRICSWTATLI